MLRSHVVILGAGFGGVYVGKELAKSVRRGEIDVTIVNRTNNFLFTPLLHEVATGSLSPRTVAEPIREIFVGTNVRMVQGTISSINIETRRVNVNTNNKDTTLVYDYLLVATGAETNYYGIPGASEYALPLKSLSDASNIRNRIIDSFEQAVITPDPVERRKLLSFAVIGGGPTGVEVAGELADFVHGMVKRYYGRIHCRPEDQRRCDIEEVSITLVHAGKELLEQFSPRLRKAAHDRLVRNNIKVKVNTAVTKVTADHLETAMGDIPASVVIWSAGVKASVPIFEGPIPTLVGGRLAVDSYFRLLGSERVFAMGDVAAYTDVHEVGPTARPLPQLAQVAQSEAVTVANNIIAAVRRKPMRDYHYHSRGSMVSVGQWFAIGEILSMKISGRLTWWMWRTVYLFKFASNKKRIRIAFEWALELFFPRDITKLT